MRSRSARPSINALISGAPEWRVVFGVSRLTNGVDRVPFGRLRQVFGPSGGTEFWNALNREISESGKNLGRIVAPRKLAALLSSRILSQEPNRLPFS